MVPYCEKSAMVKALSGALELMEIYNRLDELSKFSDAWGNPWQHHLPWNHQEPLPKRATVQRQERLQERQQLVVGGIRSTEAIQKRFRLLCMQEFKRGQWMIAETTERGARGVHIPHK